jgi:hypothetical protein
LLSFTIRPADIVPAANNITVDVFVDVLVVLILGTQVQGNITQYLPGNYSPRLVMSCISHYNICAINNAHLPSTIQ